MLPISWLKGGLALVAKTPKVYRKLVSSRWIPDIKWSELKNPPAVGNQAYVPTEIEHLANVTTHLLAILPSFYGLQFLLGQSTTWRHTLCAIIYGTALMLLFVISSLFHSIFFIDKNSALKRFLHRLDRAAIFLFISAAATPWLILNQYSSWGQIYYTWMISILGIVYQTLYHEKYKTFEVMIYCITAGLPFTALYSMQTDKGKIELITGAVIYLIGMVFFKLDGRLPFAHAIWHLFVDAATLVHFEAVRRHLFNGSS